MKTIKEYLGKVSITTEGKHDVNKAYARLSLVYTGEDENIRSYISKKSVPKGVNLSNEEYWQPIAINNSGGSGSFEEQDPHAITNLYIRHYDDENVDIPEEGTYLIADRTFDRQINIRLEDLDWPVILGEKIQIPNFNQLSLQRFDYNGNKRLTLSWYDEDDVEHEIDAIELALASSNASGLLSSALYNALQRQLIPDWTVRKLNGNIYDISIYISQVAVRSQDAMCTIGSINIENGITLGTDEFKDVLYAGRIRCTVHFGASTAYAGHRPSTFTSMLYIVGGGENIEMILPEASIACGKKVTLTADSISDINFNGTLMLGGCITNGQFDF